MIPRPGTMLTWNLFCSTNLSTNGTQAETIRQNSSWNYPKSLVQSELGTFQYTDNTVCKSGKRDLSRCFPSWNGHGAVVLAWCTLSHVPNAVLSALGRNLISEIILNIGAHGILPWKYLWKHEYSRTGKVLYI